MPRNTNRRANRVSLQKRAPLSVRLQEGMTAAAQALKTFFSHKRNRLLALLCTCAAVLLVVVLAVIPAAQAPTSVQHSDSPVPAEEALPPQVEVSRAPRASGVQESTLPEQVPYRFIGTGAKDFSFSEKQIDQPSIFDKELAFSAGTGNISDPVLTNLYYFNIDTGEETKLSTASIYKGEYYEALINHKWIVFLETDHGKNNIIYCLNRATSDILKVKNCTNGKPKLRMSGDMLIWMEQEADKVDQLYMLDLETQEDALLFTLEGATSYGVSAPYIYDSTIVWAGPERDAQNREIASNHSFIYYVPIGSTTFDDNGRMNYMTVQTNTYVHEPKYNGSHFIWIDTNKSPNAKLYLCERDGSNPTVIAQGVTTYNIGEDVVVYGKDQAVWVYVISTGETCRLTTEEEKAQMPAVNKRTVVWYNLSSESQSDVVRYKVLTDADLYPERS